MRCEQQIVEALHRGLPNDGAIYDRAVDKSR